MKEFAKITGKLPMGDVPRNRIAQAVEHQLREVAGLILDQAIPKALKMIPVTSLLSTQNYKASIRWLLFSHKYHTLNSAQQLLTKEV